MKELGLFSALAVEQLGASAPSDVTPMRPRLPHEFDGEGDAPAEETVVDTAPPLEPTPEISAVQPTSLPTPDSPTPQPLARKPEPARPAEPAVRRESRLQTHTKLRVAPAQALPAAVDRPHSRTKESPMTPRDAERASPRHDDPAAPAHRMTNLIRESVIREVAPRVSAQANAQSTEQIRPRLPDAPALSLPRAVKPAEPTIEIHIGRVEVRADIRQPRANAATAHTPDESLSNYLRSRGSGARS